MFVGVPCTLSNHVKLPQRSFCPGPVDISSPIIAVDRPGVEFNEEALGHHDWSTLHIHAKPAKAKLTTITLGLAVSWRPPEHRICGSDSVTAPAQFIRGN